MEQVELLEDSKIDEELSKLKDWFLIETKKITKEYQFNDFSLAIFFVNRVAKLAEEFDHHPDICIYYNKVEVTLWTHKIGGLSLLDFELAREIDKEQVTPKIYQ